METIIKKIKCPFCGSTTEIAVPIDGLIAWEDGALVQNAFPRLSATERETLISGMCLSCQRDFFSAAVKQCYNNVNKGKG